MIALHNSEGSEARNADTLLPSMLIISDEPDFCRAITARWQTERTLPAFTLVSSDISLGFDPQAFHAAIVGHIRPQSLSVVMEAMEVLGKRVLFLADDAPTLATVRERWPGTLLLKQQDHWLDTLVLVAVETLYRAFAEDCARQADLAKSSMKRLATLGRYMLDMRHNLNNALTSVLGNSELLLLEPGSLSANARSQIETIHNMSLRMHGVLQRFSSLEKELNLAEMEMEQSNPTRVPVTSIQ
jgi:signal transduction histidine kinase